MDSETRLIGTRSICGRSTSPYRGSDHDDARADRELSPPCSLAAIVAALRTLHGVTVAPDDSQITLRRGDDPELIVTFAVAADLTLPDAVFEGNPELAILALDALLPLFGPVEVTIGETHDLVDGTEPIGAVIAREQARAREELARVAAALRMFDRVQVALDLPPARKARREFRIAAWFAVLVPLAGVTYWMYDTRWSKSAVGSACTRSNQCRNACLSRDALGPHDLGGVAIEPGIRDGVCTEPCVLDGDCPLGMVCRGATDPAASAPVLRCAPRAWDTDPTPE